MAIAGFFMSAWFFFDGLVTYPKNLMYAEAFEEIQSEVTNEVERVKRWRSLAETQGWPQSVPDKSAATIRNDISGQYIFGVLSFLLGAPALYFYLRSRHQWVESSSDGLTTSWGQTVRFSDVTQLNKKKWDAKGIARAHYNEAGQQRTFVFDDFKFERQPLGQILRQLESVLQPEMIVGGISEAERDRRKKEAAAQTGDDASESGSADTEQSEQDSDSKA
jgi:hypothetical protein